eukprot:TRINITY_DN50771_c0_g1_i1.p1 TRINITY_DN50771_c0_g1~~TRINITY_DN50771_c0_g1_i1.p1  ORF type:complete len:404 (+),score=84.94 TRINITY_DN50771_c0_g1_i1:83-1294(+)
MCCCVAPHVGRGVLLLRSGCRLGAHRAFTPLPFIQRRGFASADAGTPAAAPRAGQLDAYLRLIRFDKQIGTWLLLIPCWWSIALAQTHLHAVTRAPLLLDAVPAPDALLLFSAGALCMRSCGCIINDMWDRDFDSKVARTRTRPIASGEISLQRAALYAGGHFACGLAVLLSLHPCAVACGAVSVPFIIAYPLMKRVTYLPQLFLGVTFNWGAMLGWTAVIGSVDWSVCGPLWAAGISWTLLYDTVYAHQDKEDDKMIGVKSSALLFGDSKTPLACFGISTWAFLCTSAWNCGVGAPFYPIAAGATAWLLLRLRNLDLDDTAQCGGFFLVNRNFGLLIFFGFVAALLFDHYARDPPSARPGQTDTRELLPHVHLGHNLGLLRDVLTGRRAFDWDLLRIRPTAV